MGKISSFLFLLCSCACTSCDFTSFAETDEKKTQQYIMVIWFFFDELFWVSVFSFIVTTELFIFLFQKQTAVAAGGIKSITLRVPRGISQERRENENGISSITIVCFLCVFYVGTERSKVSIFM